MNPPPITQLGTLKMVRRPLPPPRKVILDKMTKARRKRVKKPEGFWQAEYGQWQTNVH